MDNIVKLAKNSQEIDSELSEDDNISLGNFSDELIGHYPKMKHDLPIQNFSASGRLKNVVKNIYNDQINLSSENKLQEQSSRSIGEFDSQKDQIKILQEKLFQTNNRLFECKNTCLSLRQQINKAQKIISEEIGEHVTIANLSNHQSKWKGRSQQILQLQHKVIQLQNRINEYEKTSRPSSTLKTTRRDLLYLNKAKAQNDQFADALTTKNQVHGVENRYDDKKIDMKNVKDKTQQENVKLKNELNVMKDQVEQLQIKLKERETEIETLKLEDTENKLEHSFKLQLNMNQTLAKNCNIKEVKSVQESNEYINLMIAAETERKSLLDLIAILNQRLDKERSDTDHLSQLYRHEKQKNSKLETRVHQLEMAQVQKINTGYRKKNPQSMLQFSPTDQQINIEQMQYKLEFLEEECLTLKTRLTTLNQEKHQDFMLYKQMLEQSKKIFQNAYRYAISVKENVSPYLSAMKPKLLFGVGIIQQVKDIQLQSQYKCGILC
ncbi:spindle pole body component 110 [Chelonus insularis]|uniref:spindle pole body component 110 n=1 Tax=Chelonus insularis TaxID=460826 RepID=UPI00158D8D38|nr:spindle pole body component 110 [Chelonus insularis]